MTRKCDLNVTWGYGSRHRFLAVLGLSGVGLGFSGVGGGSATPSTRDPWETVLELAA